MLIRLYEKVINQLDYSNKLNQIVGRYEEIVTELNMNRSILVEIKNHLLNLINVYHDKPERLLDGLKVVEKISMRNSSHNIIVS